MLDNACDEYKNQVEQQSMIYMYHRKYPLITIGLYLGVKVTHNVALYIRSHMHLQSLKLLCLTVEEEIHLQENIFYDLGLGGKVT